VQNLQRDFAARLMHGLRHHPMALRGRRGGERARKRLGPARDVGRKAAGDDQTHSALGPLAEIGGQLAQVPPFFKSGVHRPHQHAIFQEGVPQVQRTEQVGIGRKRVQSSHSKQRFHDFCKNRASLREKPMPL
jgi:hypothetical protein